MAADFGRNAVGTEFSPPSRKRRIYVRNTDLDRIKQESAHLEAMGGLGSPTTPGGSPLLERLLQLEQHMDLLEQKFSPRGLADLSSPSSPSLLSSPTTPSSLERRCRSAKCVLLETEAKGTLVERIQRLEKRISQHSMDLEKAFSSGRFSSSRPESRHGESNHSREEPEHLESPSHRDSWSEAQEISNSQEAYDNNLEVSPSPNLLSKNHGSAGSEQLTEDATTRNIHLELEDKHSTPSPTVEAQTNAIPERPAGANESSEAETAGKTMEDENGLRKSKSEETTASESTTASASISVPTEAVETEHVDAKNDIRETKEQLSVKPTMELVQNEYDILKDGGVARDLIHFRSLDVPLGKLETDFVKEVDNQPNEQSEALALVPAQVPEDATQSSASMKKEMVRKQSFKHMRERIQNFFGLKEADPETKGTSRQPRLGSKEETNAATKPSSRPHRLGSKETDSATKPSSRPLRLGFKETDSATKAPSRSRRFGSKETDLATKAPSRPHRFGSKETDPATKATSRWHKFGSKEINSATKGTSGPHRFGSSIL